MTDQVSSIATKTEAMLREVDADLRRRAIALAPELAAAVYARTVAWADRWRVGTTTPNAPSEEARRVRAALAIVRAEKRAEVASIIEKALGHPLPDGAIDPQFRFEQGLGLVLTANPNEHTYAIGAPVVTGPPDDDGDTRGYGTVKNKARPDNGNFLPRDAAAFRVATPEELISAIASWFEDDDLPIGGLAKMLMELATGERWEGFSTAPQEEEPSMADMRNLLRRILPGA